MCDRSRSVPALPASVAFKAGARRADGHYRGAGSTVIGGANGAPETESWAMIEVLLERTGDTFRQTEPGASVHIPFVIAGRVARNRSARLIAPAGTVWRFRAADLTQVTFT